ncbi:FtsB family cell division protein [Schaalia sp. lx-260]|uniref:FtsB family cell division protein n=1 Tax=Schaalia sp. lx-260 TaxID=2899082 RepID=UPI001E51C5D3|nr:septum formation initiator family protein [Schaalia sp. lx-260]MCD4550273.1 septum formation initiator family protein [Schaalia sp. lx-260]
MNSLSGPSRPRPPKRSNRRTGTSARPSVSRAQSDSGKTLARNDEAARKAAPIHQPRSRVSEDPPRAAEKNQSVEKSQLPHSSRVQQALSDQKTRVRVTSRLPRQKRARRSASMQSDAQTQHDKRVVSLGGIEFSVRFLGVAITCAVLCVLLLPSLYQWWQQEHEYNNIVKEVAQAQERNEQLSQQLKLWDDPSYIASQARTRLGYVKRGETQFTVADPGEEYREQSQVAAAQREGPARPWVQIFVLSLDEADRADEHARAMTVGAPENLDAHTDHSAQEQAETHQSDAGQNENSDADPASGQ